MNNSQYLIFLHPEIIPHLQSIGIIEIVEINGSKYMPCSTINASPLPGFLDVTLPRIQGDQNFDFAFSLPIHCVIYICWASFDKIRGFRNIPKDIDNHLEPPDHSLSGSEPKHHFETGKPPPTQPLEWTAKKLAATQFYVAVALRATATAELSYRLINFLPLCRK